MKKILVLLAVLVFSGCTEGQFLLLDQYAREQLYGENVYQDDAVFRAFMDRNNLYTQNDIFEWIINNIEYVDQGSYYGFEAGVQHPYITYQIKKGNCEAFCTLAEKMLSNRGISSNIIGVHITRTDVDHAILQTDTGYYDFQQKRYVDNELITGAYKYLFDVEDINFI